MTKYIVQGGKPLFGEVEISGAKNAAVAIIPAALMVDGVCRIENIPQISDVTMCLKILEQLGAMFARLIAIPWKLTAVIFTPRVPPLSWHEKFVHPII